MKNETPKSTPLDKSISAAKHLQLEILIANSANNKEHQIKTEEKGKS